MSHHGIRLLEEKYDDQGYLEGYNITFWKPLEKTEYYRMEDLAWSPENKMPQLGSDKLYFDDEEFLTAAKYLKEKSQFIM